MSSIRPSAKVNPAVAAAAIAPPTGQHRKLDHAWVSNPSAAQVYIRVLDGGTEVYNDALAAGLSAPIVYDYEPSGALTVTATTSDDGSGAPTSTIEFTPRWARIER